MDLTPLYVVLGALARSIIGWAKKSLADGRIDEYEWKLLAETIIRVGFLGVLCAYIPGINLSWFDATIVAILVDMALSAIKTLKKPKK